MKIIYAKSEVTKLVEFSVKLVGIIETKFDVEIPESMKEALNVVDIMKMAEDQSGMNFGFYKSSYNKETEEFIIELSPEMTILLLDATLEVVEEVGNFYIKNKFKIMMALGAMKHFVKKTVIPGFMEIVEPYKEMSRELFSNITDKVSTTMVNAFTKDEVAAETTNDQYEPSGIVH
jgi:hypothetical protein